MKEREKSISLSGAQLQAEGGMGPGTADFCVEAVHGAFLWLSRELSLLHTMCVGRNTLIGQNLLKIVESRGRTLLILMPLGVLVIMS